MEVDFGVAQTFIPTKLEGTPNVARPWL